MYLTTEAIDKTLCFVVHHSGKGSKIVFDYIYRGVLEGIQKHGEVSNMRRYRFMTGEGLTFGIDEGTVGSFLIERGFLRVKDISTNDLRQTYFTGKNAYRQIAPGYGIVVAEV